MKKILALAVALLGVTGIANAQIEVMRVNMTDGTTVEYEVSRVESVTHKDDPWVLVGVGDYRFSGITESGVMYDCNLYHNSEDPTQWKIEEFLTEGYPLNFTYDEETGVVQVADQNLGWLVYLYGEFLWIDEANHFLETNEYLSGQVDENSYYDAETDSFHFAVAYYISSGYFGYTGLDDAGYDVFTLTSREVAQAPAGKTPDRQVGMVEETLGLHPFK